MRAAARATDHSLRCRSHKVIVAVRLRLDRHDAAQVVEVGIGVSEIALALMGPTNLRHLAVVNGAGEHLHLVTPEFFLRLDPSQLRRSGLRHIESLETLPTLYILLKIANALEVYLPELLKIALSEIE